MLRILMAAVLSLAAGEAAAQETSFLLINGTAYPISQLAVSESDFNFWTPNVLHPPPIKAGERRQVTFNAPDDLLPGRPAGRDLPTAARRRCGRTSISARSPGSSWSTTAMTGMTTASYDD